MARPAAVCTPACLRCAALLLVWDERGGTPAVITSDRQSKGFKAVRATRLLIWDSAYGAPADTLDNACRSLACGLVNCGLVQYAVGSSGTSTQLCRMRCLTAIAEVECCLLTEQGERIRTNDLLRVLLHNGPYRAECEFTPSPLPVGDSGKQLKLTVSTTAVPRSRRRNAP